MKILVTDGFMLWNFIFELISITFGRLIGRFYPQTRIKWIKSIFTIERVSLFSSFSEFFSFGNISDPNRKENQIQSNFDFVRGKEF